MDLRIFETGPLQVNTYELTDEETKEAVLIDVGGSFDIIKRELDIRDFKIKYVLNTHGHFDHILGEFEIKKFDSDIPIYLHQADMPHINNIHEELKLYGFEKNMEESLDNLHFVDENTDLSLGDKKIKVLYTPGHSKGSVSYYIDGFLFPGDALFYHNIGRTDLYEGNYDELISSIKEKILTLPEDTKVYPGHGPCTTIKNEKQENPYLV